MHASDSVRHRELGMAAGRPPSGITRHNAGAGTQGPAKGALRMAGRGLVSGAVLSANLPGVITVAQSQLQPLPTGVANLKVPIGVTNTESSAVSWVVRGWLYGTLADATATATSGTATDAGNSVGSFTSQSTGTIPAGGSVQLQMPINGAISTQWAGQTLYAVFKAVDTSTETLFGVSTPIPLTVAGSSGSSGGGSGSGGSGTSQLTLAVTTPPAATVGGYGTVGVTVGNAGSTAAYALVDGQVDYNGTTAADFAAQSFTVAAGGSQTVTLQTTGRFGAMWAGRSVTDVLRLKDASGAVVTSVTTPAYTVSGTPPSSGGYLSIPTWAYVAGGGILGLGAVLGIAAAARRR